MMKPKKKNIYITIAILIVMNILVWIAGILVYNQLLENSVEGVVEALVNDVKSEDNNFLERNRAKITIQDIIFTSTDTSKNAFS